MGGLKTKYKLLNYNLFWTINPFEFKRYILKETPLWRAILRLIRNKWDFSQNSKNDMEITAVRVLGPLIVIYSTSSFKNTDHECLKAALSKARQTWWMSKMSCFCNSKCSKGLETLSDRRGVFWRETLHRKLSWWWNFLLSSKLRLSWNLVEVTALGSKPVTSNETQGAGMSCLKGSKGNIGNMHICATMYGEKYVQYIFYIWYIYKARQICFQTSLICLYLSLPECLLCNLQVTRFLTITELSSV